MHNEGYFDDPRQNKQAIETAAGYSVLTCFVNTCTTTIYIKDRSGIITEIEPASHIFRNNLFLDPSSLYIFQNYAGKTDSLLTWKDQYQECDPDFQTKAMTARANMHVNSGYDRSFKTSTGKISYKVNLAGNAVNKKIVFVDDYDVVVIAGCTLHEAVKAHHPRSATGKIEANIAQMQLNTNSEIFKDNTNGLFFQCRYVVNDLKNHIGKRIYGVFANKRLFAIDSQENWEFSNEELYVVYRGINGELLTNCFNSLQEANASDVGVMFYETIEEAQTAIREAPEYQSSIKAIEIESKLQLAELALNKVVHERDNLARKSLEDQRKHTATLEELEQERATTRAESDYKLSDMGRKNTYDIFKYVPLLITSFLGILTLFAKKK